MINKNQSSVSDCACVKKIIFRNENTGWSVVWVVNEKGLSYTATGVFPSVVKGCWYNFIGNYTDHPSYGFQMKVSKHEEAGFRDNNSLRSYFYEIFNNEKLASNLVLSFGLSAIDILDREPETVKTLLDLSDDNFSDIMFCWNKSRYIHKIVDSLSNFGIDVSLAYKIYNRYGYDSLEKIDKDPYSICVIKGIQFGIGDDIATSKGMSYNDPIRIRAIVYFSIVNAANDGHCYVNESVLDLFINRTLKNIQNTIFINKEQKETALSSLLLEGKIKKDNINGEFAIYLSSLYGVEDFIANEINDRLNLGEIKELEADFSLFDKTLDHSQEEALKKCLSNRICILTGVPGSGKTVLSQLILDTWKKNNLRYIACCPTGMGTKQIEIKTNHKAKTIHRMFKFMPLEDIDNFKYETEHMLHGINAILIDELSMVGTPIFSGILSALPKDIRMIFVGDPEQLPSIEPGNLLKDMIDSGRIPVAELTEPHRFAKKSSIINVSNSIRKGESVKIPRPSEYKDEDMIFISKNNKDSIIETIKKLINGFLKDRGYGIDDIQILTPLRISDMGTIKLNRELKLFFNDISDSKCVENHLYSFNMGDRVIQTENNYDKEIYNGDIGRIEYINNDIGVYLSDLLDVVSYSKNEMYQLELAYALSVHKSQGTEYPVVILICHNNFGRMLRRRVYYTGITRAQKLCIIIGQEGALMNAIENDNERLRLSSLKSRISNL